MKNFLKLIILLIILIISLSCKDTKKNSGYELALITDIGTIDDKSFTQGSWEGSNKYPGVTINFAPEDIAKYIESIFESVSFPAGL